jgi:molybdate transport system regulatory protein
MHDRRNHVKPAVRFHIRDRLQKSDVAIGPGKIALLEAIGATGSITAAAKRLGMSYRRAWLLVDQTNRLLVEAAVKTATGGRRGGGAVLTPSGADLVLRYRAIERDIDAAVGRSLRTMFRRLPRRGPPD